MKVTVYSTSNCVQCMTTKRMMDNYGIRYEEVNLEENLDLLENFKAQGYLAAPIVTTDIKIWSGFRHDKIKSLATYLMGESKGANTAE
jgi:glutaredoxin-like protein NrdH